MTEIKLMGGGLPTIVTKVQGNRNYMEWLHRMDNEFILQQYRRIKPGVLAAWDCGRGPVGKLP